MCKAIEDMMETARTKGVQQGIEQGMEQGIEQGLERGMKQGMEQGLERGMKQGMERGLIQGTALGEHQLLMRLIQSKYDKGKNLRQIADECETTEENVVSIMEEMNLVF